MAGRAAALPDLPAVMFADIATNDTTGTTRLLMSVAVIDPIIALNGSNLSVPIADFLRAT